MIKMRFAFVAVGLLGLLGSEVRAQQTMPSVTAIPLGGNSAPVDEATQERREEVDRNYRAVKGTIPAQETAIDPWAGMRGAEDKGAQKPAKGPKTSEKKKPAVQ